MENEVLKEYIRYMKNSPILYVDMTPDEDLPLRILRLYRQHCDCRWSDNSGKEPDDLLLKTMNQHQEQRAKLLDEAIRVLEASLKIKTVRVKKIKVKEDTMFEWDKWQKAGWDSPTEAESWYNAGWEYPMIAIEWYTRWKSDPGTAGEWFDAGWADPKKARRWYNAGWRDPETARELLDAGWEDPREARRLWNDRY